MALKVYGGLCGWLSRQANQSRPGPTPTLGLRTGTGWYTGLGLFASWGCCVLSGVDGIENVYLVDHEGGVVVLVDLCLHGVPVGWLT